MPTTTAEAALCVIAVVPMFSDFGFRISILDFGIWLLEFRILACVRMPQTLRPRRRTSLGHLILACRPVAGRMVSQTLTAAQAASKAGRRKAGGGNKRSDINTL